MNSALIPAAPAASEIDEMGLPGEAYWKRLFSDNSTSRPAQLAAVYGCAQVITSAISAMPLQLFRSTGKMREREKDHPVAKFLATRPNQVMTWPQLREAILFTTVLQGNRHVRTFWKDGYPSEMFPIPEGKSTAKLTKDRRLIYEVEENEWNIPAGTFSRPEIAHFKALTGDGINGINPIKHCRLTLAGAVALDEYGKSSAEEGAPLMGLLSIEKVFKNGEDSKNARVRLNESVSNARSSSQIAIIEGSGSATKFHPLSMSMRDAQFLESKQFSVIEICRIFNVPPHKIQDLARATFSNIEHQSLEFYTGCLVPWITRLEATYNECLLTDSDRAAGLFIKHNADGLLRGDQASRSTFYREQISMGMLSPNEGRALEDRPPVDGGDKFLFPINHTTLEKIGEEPAKPADPAPTPPPAKP